MAVQIGTSVQVLPLDQARTLAFAADLRSDLVLLEADDALVSEILKSGAVVKGGLQQPAVLSCNDQSFQLKTAKTTNSLLLISLDQEGLSNAEELIIVEAVASSQLELVPSRVDLDQLELLLKARPYTGPPDDMDAQPCQETSHSSGYSRDELLSQLQAGPGELEAALVGCGALQLDSRWHLIEPGYHDMFFEVMTLTAIQNGWELPHIPLGDMVQELKNDNFDPRVSEHCLRQLSDGPVQGQNITLSNAKVCLRYAHKLLSDSQMKGITCGRLLEEWQQIVPQGFLPSLDLLRGHALFDGVGDAAEVISFPVESLPKDPAARFPALFAARPEWKLEDLSPYLEGLQVGGQSREALLLKHCRFVQPKPSVPGVYCLR